MCPQGFGEPIQRGIDELSLKLLLLAAPRTPGSRCLSFPSPFPAGDVSDHVSSPPPPLFPFPPPSPRLRVFISHFFFFWGGGDVGINGAREGGARAAVSIQLTADCSGMSHREMAMAAPTPRGVQLCPPPLGAVRGPPAQSPTSPPRPGAVTEPRPAVNCFVNPSRADGSWAGGAVSPRVSPPLRSAALPRIKALEVPIIPHCCKSLFWRSSITR